MQSNGAHSRRQPFHRGRAKPFKPMPELPTRELRRGMKKRTPGREEKQNHRCPHPHNNSSFKLRLVIPPSQDSNGNVSVTLPIAGPPDTPHGRRGFRRRDLLPAGYKIVISTTTCTYEN